MLRQLGRRGHGAARRSWQAAAGTAGGGDCIHAGAPQLLQQRGMAVDVEQARARAQELSAAKRAAAGEQSPPGGSGAMDVFDRRVKTQQARQRGRACRGGAASALRVRQP
jgi:hypothetical protein